MQVKKNPKYDLGRRSLFFFQLGMIVMLFLTWQLLEWKTIDNSNLQSSQLDIDDTLDEIIPVTEQLTTPPPPPPPPPVVSTVILEVEDEADVEETLIVSTETDQNQEILDVEQIQEEVIEEEEIVNVPFAVIENVPIYPGCENETSNGAKKACMSKAVDLFVKNNFDTSFAADVGLEGRQRIFVTFKINKNGNVTDVRARAPHPKLEEEALRVVKSLPKMIPGKQRGVPVGVLYGLPIIFQVVM